MLEWRLKLCLWKIWQKLNSCFWILLNLYKICNTILQKDIIKNVILSNRFILTTFKFVLFALNESDHSAKIKRLRILKLIGKSPLTQLIIQPWCSNYSFLSDLHWCLDLSSKKYVNFPIQLKSNVMNMIIITNHFVLQWSKCLVFDF